MTTQSRTRILPEDPPTPRDEDPSMSLFDPQDCLDEDREEAAGCEDDDFEHVDDDRDDDPDDEAVQD